MKSRCLLLLGCLVVTAVASAQSVANKAVTLTAVGSPCTGFTVADQTGVVATVLLGSNGAITAAKVQQTDSSLRFAGLACKPTPTLGPGSFIEVRLVNADDPYPRVSFKLELQRFDQAAWEAAHGKEPFHFLAAPLEGAEVFHQRGWMIGTPVVDDYIQMKAEGPGKTVVSDWSRNWMYSPPIGAYPTAVAGLWQPAARRYVGYEFHGPRLTDHTEKDFGTTYCWDNGKTKQFFCLTWPYGENYIKLRYPKTPVTCGTSFRLLWSRNMGPDDDPNRFVQEFIWKTYADLLPASERMNDLSWLPGSMRLNDFPAPGPLGNFVHKTGPDGDRWWQPGVNIAGGVGYFSPVDYYYRTKQDASIRKLGEECRKLVTLGKWMDVGGDRCFYWKTPLDGGGAPMFGPGVDTTHHVQGWYSGLALLDYVRNDPAGAADLLPVVDGVLRYTRQILYTRNCYPDVPAAQFAWSATPCVTFCLQYYYHFRNDPERRELAQLAYKLARSMTYRYLAIWPCDNDPSDDLDSSFMMEPNAGLPWLGCACANEIWVYNIAMLYEYLSTGDPIMGHYLRGMLERYHELFQDQQYPTVAQYPSDAFTERYGLYDECPQGRGKRADYGGLWGGLERLIWPMGSATVRVVCGEKAAMAFNRGGRHTDIDEYRYSGDGNCSFKLVPLPGSPAVAPDATLDVAVTFPFFDLQTKRVEVWRWREGRKTTLAPQVVRYPAEASTIMVKGVKPQDEIIVGDQGKTPWIDCTVVRQLTPLTGLPSVLLRDGFRLANFSLQATEGISTNWDDLNSYAGYEPGTKTIYGVPFVLNPPDTAEGKVCVGDGAIPLREKPRRLFVLVSDLKPEAALVLRRDGQREERISLADAVPVIKGWPPIFRWHLDLAMVDNGGKPIVSVAPRGCKIFAMTSTSKPDQELAPTLAALAQRRAEVLAEAKMAAALADLKPLFEAASGHIAILPTPTLKNPHSAPLVRLLAHAGLVKHVAFLSREDLINPFVFNRRNIWLACYLGSEDYYQTINRPGDGDAALRGWLRSGGTLVSLASGPFPFYYNESDKPVVSAPKFGLPVCGSGAGNRADTIDVADIGGWEKPPADLQLSFRVNPGAKTLTGLPATLPWLKEADQRWRPLVNVVGKENEYTPLITLQDQTGKSHGDAVAMIQYKSGDLAGARVAYVWHAMRTDPAVTQTIIIGLLKHLLSTAGAGAVPGSAGILPAAVPFASVPNGTLPPGWFVTAGDWAVQDGVLVGKNSGTDGWAPSGIVTGSADDKDYTLKLRFQVRQYGGDFRDGPWIGFRYTGTGECYALAFQQGLMLHKFHQGAGTNDSVQFASAQWAHDTAWHNLAISVKGKHIEVMLDGARVISADDNNLLGVGPVPAGGICLSARKWTASKSDTIVAFDDLRVE